MKTLRVGIIGCGNMGRRHGLAYRHCAPMTRVTACFDTVQASARSLTERIDCEVESSIDTLLERDDIDAVSICTVETAHLDPVVKAARAGKHILLEKPMALNMDDALAMKRAADQSGVKFMVGHLFRFDHRCAEVKRSIDAGRIGEVVSVDCRFHGTPCQQDRIKDTELSIFVFRGCHGIDLMRWYTNSEPSRVYAECVEGSLRSKGYHSEDAVFCLMRFLSGAVGCIEINSHVPTGHPTAGQATMTIIGTRGMIEQDLATPWLTLTDDQGITYSQGNQKDLWFQAEIEAFARHVLDDGPNIATADDAIAALRISLAVIEAARLRQPATLDWSEE